MDHYPLDEIKLGHVPPSSGDTYPVIPLLSNKNEILFSIEAPKDWIAEFQNLQQEYQISKG